MALLLDAHLKYRSNQGAAAREALESGALVVLPTDTVYDAAPALGDGIPAAAAGHQAVVNTLLAFGPADDQADRRR